MYTFHHHMINTAVRIYELTLYFCDAKVYCHMITYGTTQVDYKNAIDIFTTLITLCNTRQVSHVALTSENGKRCKLSSYFSTYIKATIRIANRLNRQNIQCLFMSKCSHWPANYDDIDKYFDSSWNNMACILYSYFPFTWNLSGFVWYLCQLERLMSHRFCSLSRGLRSVCTPYLRLKGFCQCLHLSIYPPICP